MSSRDRISNQRYDLNKVAQQKREARDRLLNKTTPSEQFAKPKKEKKYPWHRYSREMSPEQIEARKGFMDDLFDWQRDMLDYVVKSRQGGQSPFYTSGAFTRQLEAYKSAQQQFQQEYPRSKPWFTFEPPPEPEFTCMWCAAEFQDEAALEAHEGECS